MKLKDKIHNYLQEKALDKAILNTMGDIGEYYFDDQKLRVIVQEDKLNEFNDLDFYLPSWSEINKKAIRYYKRFNIKEIKKVKYIFNSISQEKDLNITAIDSDVYLGNNNFTNIKINDADNVEIYGDPIEGGGINITANNIQISRFNGHTPGNLNLKSLILVFNDICLLYAKNMNFNSEMIEFDKSYLFSNNINLKSDLIVTKDAKLSAVNKINIIDNNLDEIKGVDAPIIIYNGQNITHSEGIVMPKLRRNLIDVLRQLRNKVETDIQDKLKVETKKIEQNINNKPITKILKK